MSFGNYNFHQSPLSRKVSSNNFQKQLDLKVINNNNNNKI